MLPGSSTSLTALFHVYGSHLKLLECVVDGTGEVVLEVRRLQKTDISSYQQKGTGAPQLSRWQISFLLPQESRSPEKLARRLRGGGLYARRPVVCVPLTRQHRTARLQWCCEHHNWTEQDWACVLFSDESRFSLSSDCRRQLIWRESGTAYHPENIQEKDRYPTCSIMVWAGIMINGRTRLHVVANGTMTGQQYIDEVLLPHDCLDSEGIQRLVWPARSPDLNPIENVWDALGRQVAGRNYPPTSKNTLIRALTEEWDKLPQQLLDNVVQSMKIADFGLSTNLSEPDEVKYTMVGTPNFMSPEMVRKSPHGLKLDCWSLGCILYALLVGKPPFDHRAYRDVLNNVLKKEVKYPKYISSEAKEVLDALLAKDHSKRICINGMALKKPVENWSDPEVEYDL
ncbi:hypothetical protein TNCV_2952031 [Trichonephila clavipes]|nr:hypothetical protein TNCV_2952031 [Trichonephila clavipes]